MKAQNILVGTSKGLAVVGQAAEGWQINTIHFSGMPVNMVYADPISGAWWISLAHHHWGTKLHRSPDQGTTWESIPVPTYPAGTVVRDGKAAKLKKIWCLAQGGPEHPDRFWLGTEPGGLFVTNDQGKHFELVSGLWDHPSRSNPMQWFGTGRNEAFIHSILVDPRNSDHVYVAVSCAGVFESWDAGKSWEAKNRGLKAAYLPNPAAEVGHDPHMMHACKLTPDVLWQQNHCGIFRSVNGGQEWMDVSGPDQFPHYGFALAIDEEDPLKAWVIPAESDEVRQPRDLALQVHMTKDGGQHWQALTNGLPQEHCFDLVFRHAFAFQKPFMVFGTTNGNLFLSDDEGMNWQHHSAHLARISAVCFG